MSSAKMEAIFSRPQYVNGSNELISGIAGTYLNLQCYLSKYGSLWRLEVIGSSGTKYLLW